MTLQNISRPSDIQQMKPNRIQVADENGKMVIDANGQEEIIRNWFQSKFDLNDEAIIEEFPPQTMSKPFTKVEVLKAIKSLKNGKSAGKDNLNAELLKYGPYQR